MTSSGFKQPENFDEVASQDDWSMYAGGNDWESGITWIAVRFGDGWRGNRVWIEVKHDNPDSDQSQEGQKAVKKQGEKAWKTWVKVAKRLKGSKGTYSYKEAFKQALKDTEMKPYIRQSGTDSETWSATGESAAVVAAVLLEDSDMIFTSDMRGVTFDFDRDTSARATGTIKWRLHIEARDWGIQNFIPMVTSVDLAVDFEEYDETVNDEDVERRLLVQWQVPTPRIETDDLKTILMSVPQKWQVESGFDQGSPGPASGLRPRFVEVNSRRRKVTVLF